MQKLNFIIREVLSIIIQYALTFIFFFFLFKIKLSISLIITIVIFIIHLTLTIIVNKRINNSTFDEVEEKNEDIEKLIDDVNKKYQFNLQVKYIEINELGPAWIFGTSAFINTKYQNLNDVMTGVLAHEVGHLISGVCRYTYLDSLKPGSIISRVLKFIVAFIYNNESKTGKKHVLSNIAYGIYFLFSFIDQLLIYPLMRRDEFEANKNAVTIGFGEELKCYYGVYCLNKISKFEMKLDRMHPDVQQMIDKINEQMKKKSYEKDVYFAKDKLYYAESETLTFKIPNNIKTIKNRALHGLNIKKLNLNNTEILEPSALDDLLNLEELIIPSKLDVTKRNLLRLKSLKIIKVKDQDTYNSLYNIMNEELLDKKIDIIKFN